MIITDIYKTVNYGDVEIIHIDSSTRVTVKFLNTGATDVFTSGNIRKGMIKDKFAPTVCGQGYLGNGLPSGGGVRKKAYTNWVDMLTRCYSQSYHERQPTYIGCYVCEEWKDFGTFELWHDENYIDGFQLDKDTIIDGNKVYMPSACSFVSHKENTAKAHAKSYRFKSPCGVIIDVYNLSDFCRDNALEPRRMCDVSSGARSCHKGWAKAE